jgi:hypothetical protein
MALKSLTFYNKNNRKKKCLVLIKFKLLSIYRFWHYFSQKFDCRRTESIQFQLNFSENRLKSSSCGSISKQCLWAVVQVFLHNSSFLAKSYLINWTVLVFGKGTIMEDIRHYLLPAWAGFQYLALGILYFS